MSVDGYIAEKNGNTDWMVQNWGDEWNWDDELKKYHTDLTKSVDGILLSRKMAEAGFIPHWATIAENPNNPQFAFAKHFTETPKTVFTKTLKHSE